MGHVICADICPLAFRNSHHIRDWVYDRSTYVHGKVLAIVVPSRVIVLRNPSLVLSFIRRMSCVRSQVEETPRSGRRSRRACWDMRCG